MLVNCPNMRFCWNLSTVQLNFSRGIQLLLSVVFALICTTPATCVAFDTNGLVAWWTANGHAQDAAGSHSGTLSGGVEFASGVQEQAFSFNGTDSYVQVPDAPDLRPTSALSLAFWAKRQRFGIDIAAEKGGDWTLGGTALGVGLHSGNSNMFYLFYAGGWQGTPQCGRPPAKGADGRRPLR